MFAKHRSIQHASGVQVGPRGLATSSADINFRQDRLRRGVGRACVGLLGLLAVVGSVGCGSRSAGLEVRSGADEAGAPARVEGALRVNDIFEVYVYGEEGLPKRYRVSDDGSVVFPFLGSLPVAGQTPNKLSEALRDAYIDRGIFRNPQVVVFLSESSDDTVSVVGAVKSPGALVMKPGFTVVQAISMAGGFTALSAKDRTVVTRKVGSVLQRFKVEAGRASSGEAPDFELEIGDIIFVPERIF